MRRSRIFHYLICFALLFGMLGGLVGDGIAAAAEESLELDCKYPVLSILSGETAEFSVDLNYLGEGGRFDIATAVPPNWVAAVLAGYPEKQIPAIEIAGAVRTPTKETVKVKFGSRLGKRPEPGEYVVTLEVSSGELRATLDLTAIVTASYESSLHTYTGRLNTEANAGEDNHISILLTNLGSAPIEDVTLSSSKPDGWSLTFSPEKIDSVDAGLQQEIDVVINPPRKTIAGDYMVTIRAESAEISNKIELRVTVLTPTIWGWVGILIVLVVIAGVGVVFWRLGRR